MGDAARAALDRVDRAPHAGSSGHVRAIGGGIRRLALLNTGERSPASTIGVLRNR